MRLLHELRFRVKAFFRREGLERELDEEIEYHLERSAERYRSRGIPAEEALRMARLEFGGVEQIKEASRDSRGLRLVETLGQDLRYAFRSLRRQSGFTVAIILTLGLGIGINAVMFGILDQLLLRDPPMMQHADRVHRVWFGAHWSADESIYSYAGFTRYLDLRNNTRSFDELAAWQNRTLSVGRGEATRELRVGVVTASFFNLFDLTPVVGRLFTAAEDRVPGGAPVAVLSYGYWQRQYGGAATVLGQTIDVDKGTYTIIGVLPRGFTGVSETGEPALFLPLTSYAATFLPGSTWYTEYQWSWMELLAKRKSGVGVAEANADLSSAFRRSWETERAAARRSMKSASEAAARSFLAPLSSERGPLPSQTGMVARWVGGVTLIVLLIACANVANLLLARALRRRREIVLRIALGVSRARLAFQFITESLLLALAGAAAGLLLAYGAAPVLRRLFLREGAAEGTAVDLRTLLFALLITALTGALTSLAPILQTRHTDLADALKTGARQGGVHRSGLRTGLLLAQSALSVLLLVGAALFVRSLRQVESHRLGYDPDQVVYVSLNLRGQQLSAGEREVLHQRLVDRARAITGVERVSLGITMPFWDNAAERIFVDGIDSTSKLGDFTMQSASPGYLATMGTRLLRGRDYTDADVAGGLPVVVVSQRMAEVLWPGQDPLGKCVRFRTETAACTSVIGVAENINQRSLTEDSGLHYYTPLAQTGLALSANRLSNGAGGIDASVFIRVRGDATEIAESVRRELQPLMPGVAYLLAYPMRQIIDPNLRSWRLGALLFLAFGGVALILAAVGLYGVIAYDVTQRTQELGVRMALGARPAGVVRLVVWDGIRVAIGGILLGSVIAWFAGPWVEPLLYQQSARDPRVFVLIAGVLLAVAALASMIPAWRAVQVSPSQALQSD